MSYLVGAVLGFMLGMWTMFQMFCSGLRHLAKERAKERNGR